MPSCGHQEKLSNQVISHLSSPAHREHWTQWDSKTLSFFNFLLGLLIIYSAVIQPYIVTYMQHHCVPDPPKYSPSLYKVLHLGAIVSKTKSVWYSCHLDWYWVMPNTIKCQSRGHHLGFIFNLIGKIQREDREIQRGVGYEAGKKQRDNYSPTLTIVKLSSWRWGVGVWLGSLHTVMSA